MNFIGNTYTTVLTAFYQGRLTQMYGDYVNSVDWSNI